MISAPTRLRSMRRRIVFENFSSRAASRTAARSVWTSTSIPGRSTLTTTSSPVGRRAGWTWASEAAPIGSGATQEKTWESGRPKSSSIWRTTSANRSGGTSSWSPESSWVISGGRMSTRVERNWPSLMRTPPISPARAR